MGSLTSNLVTSEEEINRICQDKKQIEINSDVNQTKEVERMIILVLINDLLVLDFFSTTIGKVVGRVKVTKSVY